jgi:hypothetical protein
VGVDVGAATHLKPEPGPENTTPNQKKNETKKMKAHRTLPCDMVPSYRSKEREDNQTLDKRREE